MENDKKNQISVNNLTVNYPIQKPFTILPNNGCELPDKFQVLVELLHVSLAIDVHFW